MIKTLPHSPLLIGLVAFALAGCASTTTTPTTNPTTPTTSQILTDVASVAAGAAQVGPALQSAGITVPSAVTAAAADIQAASLALASADSAIQTSLVTRIGTDIQALTAAVNAMPGLPPAVKTISLALSVLTPVIEAEAHVLFPNAAPLDPTHNAPWARGVLSAYVKKV